MSAIQAINAVNAAWSTKKLFFFSGGVFYWGEKPEQSKIYTFEYDVNIISLNRFGGVWELETVSAPFVRHSHKINVVHPKISGEQEVEKVISSAAFTILTREQQSERIFPRFTPCLRLSPHTAHHQCRLFVACM